LKSRQKSKSK
jgi:hypothetical protein